MRHLLRMPKTLTWGGGPEKKPFETASRVIDRLVQPTNASLEYHDNEST